MFDRIITLSLNPSIDITLWTQRMQVGQDNEVEEESFEAAGKAVNVARALHNYGLQPFNIILAGVHNAHRFEAGLHQEGLGYRLIEVDGYTRENLSIVQEDGSVTRFIRQGFSVSFETLETVEAILAQEVSPGTLVVLSGRLPRGITPRLLRRLCSGISAQGGKVALDTSSLSQEDLVEIKPWAIKPNRQELAGYAGRPLETVEEMVAYGNSLLELGVEHCLISLDKEGVLYLGPDKVLQVQVPEVDVVSAVGAGDSCFAGFIAGMYQGLPLDQVVRNAAAMGTAACLRRGAQPPKKLATASILLRLQAQEL